MHVLKLCFWFNYLIMKIRVVDYDLALSLHHVKSLVGYATYCA